MSEHISYRRKSMGHYKVLYDGSEVGEVRTTCYNRHWCWIVVGDRSHGRRCHYHTRDEAAIAAVSHRVA